MGMWVGGGGVGGVGVGGGGGEGKPLGLQVVHPAGSYKRFVYHLSTFSESKA